MELGHRQHGIQGSICQVQPPELCPRVLHCGAAAQDPDGGLLKFAVLEKI